MGNKQPGETQKPGHPNELCFSSRKREARKPSAKFTMALSKASVNDLKHIGIRPEIAEKLVQDKEKGKLKNLSDVVAALETSGARCHVKFEDDFRVEVDEKGEIGLLFRKKEPERGPRKSKSEKWSRHWGTGGDEGNNTLTFAHETRENKPSATKRKGVETKPKGKKRRKAQEDEDVEWNADDEEMSEEECEEEQKTNVNTASEEELEDLPGIGPSLARKIIRYREDHGDFRRLEDLDAVRGISKKLVQELEDVLTVGEVQGEEGTCFKLNPVPSNGCLQFEGREVVRIMSWNLQCFSDDKAANRGVLEVICRTILESGISIAVCQEIGDETALRLIQDELNRPTLKKIKQLKRPKSYWECVTSDVAGPMYRSREFNGFLFDTSRNIELKSHDLLEKPKHGKKQFARRPFLGFFKAKGFDFVVVSVHLKATGLDNEDLSRLQEELARIPDIVTAIHEQIPGEKDLAVVGDFNLDPDEKDFDSFRESGLNSLIPHTSFTNISTSNMDGSKCYDNVWISKQTTNHYSTGRAGVFRDNMTHPLIPDGWRMNGVVSDHCPVWAEFYCDRDVDKSAADADVEDITIKT